MSTTRKKILRFANELVAEQGLQDFTIAEVARRASISKGGVLHHFGTKEALIRAMIDEGLEEFQARFEATAQADDAPGAWTRSYVKSSFPGPDAPSIPSADPLLVGLANDRSIISSYVDRQKLWSETLSRDGIDPRLAWVVMLAADGLFFNQSFRITPVPAEMREDLIEFMLEMTRQASSR